MASKSQESWQARSKPGLTEIETVLLIFIVFVLGAIALPNLIGAQDKGRDLAVKANMRLVQIAAEAYATDHGGSYPDSADQPEFLAYLPGGNIKAGTPGELPPNPYTGKADTIARGYVANVEVARLAQPDLLDHEGQLEYSLITDSCGGKSSYAVRGAGAAKKTLPAVGGSGGTYVLSRQ